MEANVISSEPTMPFFIDTDMGVDDAVAVAWLLVQPAAQIVGFSTVFGNTTVEHATTNLLTLLDTADRQIPITIGAAAPLVFRHYQIGALLHGRDGFWGAQQHHYLSGLPRDAPAAIAAAARSTPGLTIIALGPLTNLAQALQRYPQDLAGVRLIALCGARYGGNTTPLSEFNVFADPHALEIVLDSQMRVDLVMRDAFDQLTLPDTRFIEQLGIAGGAVGQLLARMLVPYIQIATQNGAPASIPDAAAAIYALRPDLALPTSALVQVITEEGPARGQTIVADTMSYRVTLIASPNEIADLALRFLDPSFDIQTELASILARRPDNARVILTINGPGMLRLLEESLLRAPMRERQVGQSDT